ncbi:MAG: RNA polymerase sigma factor [Alphaproteobacteria bacterium]
MVQKTDENQETDEDLMMRVQNGDHEAFSAIVSRHTKLFYTAAYRMCSHQDMAEDIVQDAFLKLWQRPEIWDGTRGAKFTTWFYRVVTNQAIDQMRKIKPMAGSEVLDYLGSAEQQQEQLEQQQQDVVLERAIQTLSERQKVALNLCFYEGLSNKDAADILGVGVKALESLLMRAKAAIRRDLTGQGLLKHNEKEVVSYGS